MSELARWQSHKVVRAGKVISLTFGVQVSVSVEAADGGYTVIDVPSKVFARGRPEPGDYFVVYDDGYQSWSPKAIFEAGYTRL
jgi:hypothetical protein